MNSAKYKIILIVGLITPFLFSFILVWVGKTPTKLLNGNWQEVAWEYEKIGTLSSTPSHNIIDEELEDEISKHLVIHKSEKWRFLPNGKLLLVSACNDSTIVDYKLSGRGNMLLISNKDRLESYSIEHITENELELHYFMDVQTRGIVKINFKKDLI